MGKKFETATRHSASGFIRPRFGWLHYAANEMAPYGREFTAEDWLISVDGNRYSVPFGLIGQTVQVVREGGVLVIRHAGAVVARHPVLAGRAQTDVLPEHGPGAVSRNARRRFTSPGGALASEAETREVEIRDLAIYDQLVEAASSPLQEAA